MKPRHDRAQIFLATLAEDCPELPFEPALLPDLFSSTSERSEKSLSHIAELVEKSQGLASRVLRVANSAYYGMSTTVASLPHAIRILGINELRNIILQLGLTSVMRRLNFPKGFNFEELWEHQLRTACIARELAFADPEGASNGTVSPDDLYAAGLLHDLGKTMLACNCPDDWLAIWDLASCEEIPFHKAEEDYWGVDHAIAGARLLNFWGLPAALTEPVNWHHAPRFACEENKRSAELLAAANILAHSLPQALTEELEENLELPLPEEVSAVMPEGVIMAELMKKLAARCGPERIQNMADALSE